MELIEKKIKGSPPRRYIYVNEHKVLSLFNLSLLDKSICAKRTNSSYNTNKSDKINNTSAGADLASFFLKALKEKKPDLNKEKPPQSWIRDCNKLLKIRSQEQIEKVIHFVVNGWWLKNILCPESLYQKIDRLEIEMNEKDSKVGSAKDLGKNKEIVNEIVKKFPNRLKSGEVHVGEDYIEFNYGPMVPPDYITFSEGDFMEKVRGGLRKMGMCLEGL